MTISEVLQNQKSYHYETGNTLDVLKSMPDACIDVIVTSPAYWGLREYGAEGQLGLESSPDCRGHLTGNPCGECYVCHLIQIFRELWRVLRPEGCVWLNLGDSYLGASSEHNKGSYGKHAWMPTDSVPQKGRKEKHSGAVKAGIKEKDLIGIPWRVALALQAEGWWLRSDCVWAKISVMPFSGSGWQWERHMLKECDEKQPCPGCDKCTPNDGLILSKGSWRPTNSHEYIFQLAKSPQYFTDPLAVRQLPNKASLKRIRQPGFDLQTGEGKRDAHEFDGRTDRNSRKGLKNFRNTPGRGLWDVWVVPSQPLKAEHFAVFPPGIPELAIRASASKGGYCEHCHAPYARIVEREPIELGGSGSLGDKGAKWAEKEQQSSGHRLIKNPSALRKTLRQEKAKWQKADGKGATGLLHSNAYALGYEVHDNPFPHQITVGWKPTCACGSTHPVSAVVLDPFSGSGTTIRVANALGIRGIGIDLNAHYNEIAEELMGSVKLIQKESYAQIPDSQLSLFGD